jgi:cold shock CspA family protein
MAGSQSFGKRENEKKKQAKRLEKQKRKEERLSAGTSSPDDMIAYVDEFGNIVDTPPEQRREEVNLEDVAIATPKKEEVEVEPLKGRVEYFNASKGYGFIKDLDSAEKYFFHISAAPPQIAEGNIVTFELERGTRGMNAVGIILG